MERHVELGKTYRRAKVNFLASQGKFPRRIDREVRGIDRELTLFLEQRFEAAHVEERKALAQLEAQLARAHVWLAFGGVTSLLLGLGVTWLLVQRWVVTPISEISNAASDVVVGTWSKERAARKIHEIQGLESSLSTLAERINEQRRSLEEHVELLAQEKLEVTRALESRAQFMSTMSHELLTPMNGIIGGLQLFDSLPISKEQREITDVLHASSEQLFRLLKGLIDKIQIDAGDVHVHRQEIDPKVWGQRIFSKLGVDLQAQNLQLVIDDRFAPSRVRWDPDMMERVVTELVENAAKFTPEGGVLVQWTGYVVHDPIEVRVQDTGVGMETSAKANVFRPFWQADMSSSRKHGGTGIGLSIVKGFVEAMAGEILVQSEPGQGSTFTVRVGNVLDLEPQDSRYQSCSAILFGRGLRVGAVAGWLRDAGISVEHFERLTDMESAANRGATWVADFVWIDVDSSMPIDDDVKLVQTLQRVICNSDMSHHWYWLSDRAGPSGTHFVDLERAAFSARQFFTWLEERRVLERAPKNAT